MDLKTTLSKNITFAANFDYITYHGKTEWNVLEFLSPDITSTVPPGMERFYTLSFSNRTFLDNAYFRIAFPILDLTVGKQQVSLGTGYAWNPTDVFNKKDLLDPTYEQPGHNALRLDFPLGATSAFTALYSPEGSWNDSTVLLQWKSRVSHFDYFLTGITMLWRTHDYGDFDLQTMDFREIREKRRLFGGGLAGELLGLGVWAEFAFNLMEDSEDFYELVLGSDYTFDFETYVFVEYYRNTLAKENPADYTLNDWMRYFTAEQKAVARDQIYFVGRHPVTDFLDMGLSLVYCLSDNSLALVPTLRYSLAQNLEIIGYLNINFGQEGDVFSENMGNGAMIRARLYF